MAENVIRIGRPRRSFCFQLNGSERVWEMPSLEDLPVDQARRMASLVNVSNPLDQVDAVCDLMEELCPGLVNEVTMGDLMEIFRAWRDSSSVTVGE